MVRHSLLRRLSDQVLAWALPARCLQCGAGLPPGRPPLGLCLPCRGRLAPIRGRRCPLCLRPLAALGLPAGFVCGGCRRRPPAWDGLLVGWIYRPPLDTVIRRLKFARHEYLGAHLGRLLAGELAGAVQGAELVVPVPLHWRRRLSRGYDQARVIAQPFAERLGLALVPALRRTRPTARQTHLPRDRRRANLRGAFVGRASGAVRDRTCLLVDDVLTTGATLEAAARALRKVGAGAVVAVAAARTPDGRPDDAESGK